MRQRVCESRAVHMHGQLMLLGNRRDRRQLRQAVNRTPLGGLGHTDGRGLHVVHAHLERKRDRFCHLLRTDFTVGRRQPDEFGASREELRCAAFIGDDVCRFIAVNRAVGRRNLRQRQRVGGAAGGHRENRHVGLEDFAGNRLQTRRVGVAAVGGNQIDVGRVDGRHDIGARGRYIVAATKNYAVPFEFIEFV